MLGYTFGTPAGTLWWIIASGCPAVEERGRGASYEKLNIGRGRGCWAHACGVPTQGAKSAERTAKSACPTSRDRSTRDRPDDMAAKRSVSIRCAERPHSFVRFPLRLTSDAWDSVQDVTRYFTPKSRPWWTSSFGCFACEDYAGRSAWNDHGRFGKGGHSGRWIRRDGVRPTGLSLVSQCDSDLCLSRGSGVNTLSHRVGVRSVWFCRRY